MYLVASSNLCLAPFLCLPLMPIAKKIFRAFLHKLYGDACIWLLSAKSNLIDFISKFDYYNRCACVMAMKVTSWKLVFVLKVKIMLKWPKWKKIEGERENTEEEWNTEKQNNGRVKEILACLFILYRKNILCTICYFLALLFSLFPFRIFFFVVFFLSSYLCLCVCVHQWCWNWKARRTKPFL